MSDQIKRDQEIVALRQLIEQTYANNPEVLNALRANADALDSQLRQLPARTSPAVAIDHLTTHQWFREAEKPEVNLRPVDQLPEMRASPELLPFAPPNLGSVTGTVTGGQAHASTTHQPPMAAPVNTARAEPSVGKVPEGSLAERVGQTLARNAGLEATEREAAARHEFVVLQQKDELIGSFIKLREVLIAKSNEINALGLTSQRLSYLPKEDARQSRFDDCFYITFAGRSLQVSLETSKLLRPPGWGEIAILISGTPPGIIAWRQSVYSFAFVLRRFGDNTLRYTLEWGSREHYRITINWGQVASWLLDALMQHDFIARAVNHRNGKPTLLPPYTAH